MTIKIWYRPQVAAWVPDIFWNYFVNKNLQNLLITQQSERLEKKSVQILNAWNFFDVCLDKLKQPN
jgi:hypothetical protein